jgi:hypothetical protein
LRRNTTRTRSSSPRARADGLDRAAERVVSAPWSVDVRIAFEVGLPDQFVLFGLPETLDR